MSAKPCPGVFENHEWPGRNDTLNSRSESERFQGCGFWGGFLGENLWYQDSASVKLLREVQLWVYVPEDPYFCLLTIITGK